MITGGCRIGLTVLALLAYSGPVSARSVIESGKGGGATASNAPAYQSVEHTIGSLTLRVTNHGSFGFDFDPSVDPDMSGILLQRFCEYPKGSYTTYLWSGAIWVGAVVKGDTLVSTGYDGWGLLGWEFHPDISPYGNIKYRSNVDPTRQGYDEAVSEQDYIAVYTDTCLDCYGVAPDGMDNRPHRPLNIEVTQRSYAWSYDYADDFVLLDYSVKNIGDKRLWNVYLGIYVDADIHERGLLWGPNDDVCGFRPKQPALYLRPPCPDDSDIVNLAWAADNDGDLGIPGLTPVPAVSATRIIRTPSDSLKVSFNWWISNWTPALDYGPQLVKNHRDFGTGGLGTPAGDRNKYFVMSNGEFDFDQPLTATISPLDSVWIAPDPELARVWATGLDTRYLLSFGPFGIDPGQTLPITLAYVAGVDFHRDSANINNLPDFPDLWYSGVNFDSLGSNATWADWVYDNPGVDTDSDGYYGEFTICNLGTDSTWTCDTLIDTTADPDTSYVECQWTYDEADTIWRKGDGVPDFRGATPPPAPSSYSVRSPVSGERIRGLRVESDMSRLRIRWNGVMCENTPDVFTREIDFEGYRVWIGRDDRRGSYSVVASYDLEDYDRYEWVPATHEFRLLCSPFSLTELRCLYGSSCDDTLWHPLVYTRSHPLVLPDAPDGSTRVYYFEAQDFNRSVLANDPINATTQIRKVYPQAVKPPLNDPDSIRYYYPDQDTLYLTEEGFLKYYEYEYSIDGLLPSVPYWVNVTVFDHGSPEVGLSALETTPTLEPVAAYASPVAGATSEGGLAVYVYPNPYRIDDDYRDRGFEARGQSSIMDDRARRIHFANLPPRCTISIFTLDGDLVREIHHLVDPGSSLSQHDSWDLITRNSQQPVTGLYYWVVEDQDTGQTQVGKLVIIL